MSAEVFHNRHEFRTLPFRVSSEETLCEIPLNDEDDAKR